MCEVDEVLDRFNNDGGGGGLPESINCHCDR